MKRFKSEARAVKLNSSVAVMIHGLGTDIVRLSRIVGIVERRGLDAFSKKILSAEELPYFHAVADTKALRVRFLAVRLVHRPLIQLSMNGHVDGQ